MKVLVGYSILLFFVALTGLCGTMVIVQHNLWVRLFFVVPTILGYAMCYNMITGARSRMK